MSTIDELKEVVKETLEVRGVLDQIKARVRTEVFAALEGEYRQGSPPALSNENLLINELIRDYLSYNNYNFTASVLVSESGQPNHPMSRDFLQHELNVREEGGAASVPLLYSLVSAFVNREQQLGRVGGGGGAPLQRVERGEDEEEEGMRHFVIEGSG